MIWGKNPHTGQPKRPMVHKSPQLGVTGTLCTLANAEVAEGEPDVLPGCQSHDVSPYLFAMLDELDDQRVPSGND